MAWEVFKGKADRHWTTSRHAPGVVVTASKPRLLIFNAAARQSLGVSTGDFLEILHSESVVAFRKTKDVDQFAVGKYGSQVSITATVFMRTVREIPVGRYSLCEFSHEGTLYGIRVDKGSQ